MFRAARRQLLSLLDFLSLLDARLFDLVFAETKEFAQLRTNNEQSARQHRAGYLEKEKSGTWIGVSIGGPLERHSEGRYLRDGKQHEHNTGVFTQIDAPLDLIESKVRSKKTFRCWNPDLCFLNTCLTVVSDFEGKGPKKFPQPAYQGLCKLLLDCEMAEASRRGLSRQKAR
jgi:hypothetical protein